MKKIILTILIVAMIILLLPIRGQVKDGGSVAWQAIAYTVYDVHSYYIDGEEMKFVEGIIVEIFGVQVYNSTEPHIDDFGDSPFLSDR